MFQETYMKYVAHKDTAETKLFFSIRVKSFISVSATHVIVYLKPAECECAPNMTRPLKTF